MSERKVSLDKYVDKMPLGVASYRNSIKEVLKEFAQEVLELAAENAVVEFVDLNDNEIFDYTDVLNANNIDARVNKQGILYTINQIEI